MFNKITAREQMLLTVAAVAMLVLGYAHYRLRPAWAQWQSLDAEAAAARQQAAELQMPPPPAGDPAQLAADIARRQDELKQQEAHSRVLQRQFAMGESEREALHVEIIELAEQCGVRIKERKPADELRSLPRSMPTYIPSDDLPPLAPAAATPRSEWLALPTGPFLDGKLLADRFDRTLERMTLEASFGSLHRFLVGLDRLSWRVVVVRWDVQTGKVAEGMSGPAVLRANLVVAL